MSIDDCLVDLHNYLKLDRKLHPEKKFYVTAIVLDKKGNIIATGSNSFLKTHPMQYHFAKLCGNENQIFLHAEIAALIKCRKEPYTLLVGRILRNGQLANANPCPICRMAMKETGVFQTIYSNPNGTWTRDFINHSVNERYA